MWSVARRPRWIAALILALGVAAGFAALGQWQVGRAVQKVAEAAGYSVVREYVGHAIGTAMHETPQVPNYWPGTPGPTLKEGMVFAIEPMVNIGTYETYLLDDGWSVMTEDGQLSAHFEHTIAVTDDGPEVFTAA